MSEKKDKKIDSDVEKNKTEAMLSYFWVISLYFYLTKKKSKFVQFHAKQGIILFLLSFATIVPIFGQLFALVLTLVSIVAMIKAYSGEWYKIPFVYDLSKSIKF